jgi:hypothetical protein
LPDQFLRVSASRVEPSGWGDCADAKGESMVPVSARPEAFRNSRLSKIVAPMVLGMVHSGIESHGSFSKLRDSAVAFHLG